MDEKDRKTSPESRVQSPETESPLVHLSNSPLATHHSPLTSDHSPLASEWLGEDLESAYRRALEANEAVEWELSEPAEGAPADEPEASPCADDRDAPEAPAASEAAGTDAMHNDGPEGDEGRNPAARVTPAQVIEAALFVGGNPLTTKKLNSLLGGEQTRGVVEQAIDQLNRTYADEKRPYEVRLGEGGYRMALRPEFERVRSRVYGTGPRDVKLSQEALEVLALVAYKQPIARQQLEETRQEPVGSVVGQLLRRELIAIERDDAKPKEVKYVTTPRFLSLFGLADLDELPQADELDLK